MKRTPYSGYGEPGVTLEREAPFNCRAQFALEKAKQAEQSKQTQTQVSAQICLREMEANQTIKPNIDAHICLYLPIRLKSICDFTCIPWFVYACKCLPVGASLGSLRSPRSAFEGEPTNPFHKLSRKYAKPFHKSVQTIDIGFAKNHRLIKSLAWPAPDQILIEN